MLKGALQNVKTHILQRALLDLIWKIYSGVRLYLWCIVCGEAAGII